MESRLKIPQAGKKSRADELISPPCLGGIESFVDLSYRARRTIGFDVECFRSDAGGDAKTLGSHCFIDVPEDVRAYGGAVRVRAVRQQDGELVAAEAGNDIRITSAVLQDLCGEAQCCISHLMAAFVVQYLEMVKVDQQKRKA